MYAEQSMVKQPKVTAWAGLVCLLYTFLFVAAGVAQQPSKPKPATPKTSSSSANQQEPKPASGKSAAQVPAKEAATNQAQDAAPADIDPSQYAGSQACSDCHEAAGGSFPTNPHHKTLENTRPDRPDRQGCEACHGAGKVHAESGDPDNIVRFESVSKAGTAKICSACHDLSQVKAQVKVKSSSLHASHSKADVGCLECHSIHSAKAGTVLLKSDNVKLCSTCHESRQQ
jgi:predicted CXXCH cytochrome family protein